MSRFISVLVLMFAMVLGARLGSAPPAPPQQSQPPRPASQPRQTQITTLPGFAVQEVYSPEKSGTVVALTFDSRGRLVVSRERGPVVTLIDKDQDGKADEERVFTDKVTNCQGLEFDGDDLLAVGRGPEGIGIYRVRDADADGTGDSVTLVALSTDDIGEHGPHALFFGPDGYLYWILGNHAGLAATPDPRSPYRGYVDGQLLPYYVDPRGHATDYRSPGGIIVRKLLKEERADWQLVAGGFRNAYDAAFNLSGELFTFDSDMEWDIGLPWYRPVRTHHVPPGAEFGWRTGSAVWPDYFADSLPGMNNVGRGSPVGVAFYQGDAYPAEYQDTFLQGDWSRGRILIGTLEKSGATYRETSRDFVLGMPLNVTDIDVGPDGAVYFSKGGRNTEGGIYRVIHQGQAAASKAKPASWIDAALAQPQPRSAWSRARLAALRKEQASAWGPALVQAITSTSRPAASRARALELLQVYGPQPDESLLIALGKDPAWEVRAASTYYLGLQTTDSARRELVKRLKDADPFVRRRACEALVRTGIEPAIASPIAPVEDLFPLLAEEDRYLRWAARQVLVRTNRNLWRDAALKLDAHPSATEAMLALVQTATGTFETRALLTRELDLLKQSQAMTPDRLVAFLRVIHLTMIGDEGVRYGKIYAAMGELALARFPSGHETLDRELARTLAHLETPGAIPKILAALTQAGTTKEQQIHYAYCLRAIESGWEPAERQTLVQWFKKTQDERWKGGSSFAGFLDAMWMDVLKTMPEAERATAAAAVPTLGPQTNNKPPVWHTNETASFSEQELTEYLDFDPMAYTGNVAKGRQAYEKALCVSCHRFGDMGQEAGPDLTDVARRFKRKDLLDAILRPSKTISDQWAAVEIVTKKKESFIGVVAGETGDAVTLRTIAGGRLTVPKRDIASQKPATTSLMPEGLLNGLSLSEVRDLFTFLEQGAAPSPQ